MEEQIQITAEDNRSKVVISIQTEITILLLSQYELFGIYTALVTLMDLGFLNFLSQQELLGYLDISEPTFIQKRGKLEELGFITITKIGRSHKYRFNDIQGIQNLPQPKNKSELKKYIEKLKGKVIFETPEVIEKQKKESILSVQVEQKAKEIVKKKEEAKKKEEQRFPGEDYQIVLNAYTKYKGVGLLGPEVNRAKHAIKQMFLAQRSVKQIVDCLRFFGEHSNKEEYKWMHNWTLETVMKKLPEFIAGKLKLPEMGDDLPDL